MYRNIRLDGKKQNRPSASALSYDPQRDNAPRVTASGSGKIAEQIVEIARLHRISVHEDAVLSAALAMVNLGDEIPAELYLVVAEVLAYIYRVAEQKKRAG